MHTHGKLIIIYSKTNSFHWEQVRIGNLKWEFRWGSRSWTWCCRFVKWHLQPHRCRCWALFLLLRSRTGPRVCPWSGPLARSCERKRTRHLAQPPGEIKDRNLKMWRADWQREMWAEESQETAGMETLDPGQSLARFSIRTLAHRSTDILKIPETDTWKCLFYYSLWKETPVKKRLGWTVNTVQAPNVQIDPDRWIRVNYDQKKTGNAGFPSSRSGIWVVLFLSY